MLTTLPPPHKAQILDAHSPAWFYRPLWSSWELWESMPPWNVWPRWHLRILASASSEIFASSSALLVIQTLLQQSSSFFPVGKYVFLSICVLKGWKMLFCFVNALGCVLQFIWNLSYCRKGIKFPLIVDVALIFARLNSVFIVSVMPYFDIKY